MSYNSAKQMQKLKQKYLHHKYNHLTIIKIYWHTKPSGRNLSWAECICDCGNTKCVSLSTVIHYRINGCDTCRLNNMGQSISIGRKKRSHGQCGTRIHRIWKGIKSRCLNSNRWEYNSYGGRGIKICDDWLQFKNFYEWAHKSGYRDDLTIERINVDGDYCPENCTWATQSQQMNNTRTSRKIKIYGEIKSVREWSRDPRCVVNYHTLHTRICSCGKDPFWSLTTPPIHPVPPRQKKQK